MEKRKFCAHECKNYLSPFPKNIGVNKVGYEKINMYASY